MTNGYTEEELGWLDDAVNKQGQLDAANAEVERLTEALAAAEAPASTTEEPEPATPAVPSYEDLKAEVDAIPDNITPEEMFARLAQTGQPATAPKPVEQLTGPDLEAAMAAAEKAGDRDAFMAALDEAGAVDHSAWGSGKRVY